MKPWIALAFAIVACEPDDMALPDSRDLTATPASQVSSTLDNVLQDCIIGGKHGDIEVTHPITDGSTSTGTSTGLVPPTVSLQVGGVDWHMRLPTRVGDRLKTLKIRHFGNGVSDFNVELRKWSAGVVTVIDTIVIANAPASWQTTTQAIVGTPIALAGEYFFLRYTTTSGANNDITVGPPSDIRDRP